MPKVQKEVKQTNLRRGPGCAFSTSTMERSHPIPNNTSAPVQSNFDSGQVTWLLACNSVTWIIIPGVALFYGGLGHYKSSMFMFLLCFWSCSIVAVQWWMIGYSLCLSKTGGPFVGNLDHAFLRNIGSSPASGNDQVPALLVGLWYNLFAAFSPTVFTGAIAERTRFISTIVFMFLWTTVVFDVITYWTWNEAGWSHRFGTLDFGGGTPVHTATGFTSLAAALIVGKRKDRREKPPHNMTHVLMGTGFIWMGWLVANAGSGLSPNIRTVSTFISTNLSASMGGITWSVVDYFRNGRKWSALGFCIGAVSGLVAITPASGFVSGSSAIIFGVVGAIVCNVAVNFSHLIPIDDAYEVFFVHGVGAITGSILTGLFAEKGIAALDGTVIVGGAVYDGNWAQVYIQMVDSAAGAGWAFLVSAILLKIMDIIPGLKLRVDEASEELGLDEAELGEKMHDFLDGMRLHIFSLENRLKKLEEASVIEGVQVISVASVVSEDEDYKSFKKELGKF